MLFDWGLTPVLPQLQWGAEMIALRTLAFSASLVATPAAFAQVAVVDAWVRGVVPAQTTTGAFMQLRSANDTTLVAVSSPAAKVVEIHQMKMEGDIMRMSAVGKLALPAGATVKLEPGGYHVMLIGLVAPLKEGDAVPITLTFEDRNGKKTSTEVKAAVRALTAPAHKH